MKKRTRRIFGMLLALVLIAASVPPATAEITAEPEAEWTVLLYMCGTDLESKYSYGSQNLEEITHVFALPGKESKVNVLIETGGCSEWHTESIGIEVSPYAIQRWRLNTRAGEPSYSFELLGTMRCAAWRIRKR